MACIKLSAIPAFHARAGVIVVLSQKQVSHLSHLSKKDSSHQGQMGQVGHIKSG